ncbi:MAG: hypothetical protein KJZ65_11590 [Phycisphaerales bacterium]|nr:hypothetical protein [Phycisphaerales bacterium]
MQTDPDIQSQHLRRARLGRRRRLIVGYWVVQSVAVVSAWPLIGGYVPASLRDLWENFLRPREITIALTLVAAVTMLQLVFVLPVRPPARRAGRRTEVRRWVRALLAAALATPVGLMGVLLHAGLDLVSMDDVLLFSHGHLEFSFWVFWLIGLIPAIPIVARLCRKDLPPIISAYIAGACTGLLGYALAVGIAGFVLLLSDTSADERWWLVIGGGPLVLGWAVSTPLLLAFIRGRDTETALKRLASLIFLGTCVEILAIIPMDVFTRRKSSCYCSEGTYWALIALVPLGFVALGPMIFLVAASKRRKRYAAGCCEICGYDMRGHLKAERCPECGVGWKPPPETPPADGTPEKQTDPGG